MKAKDKARLRWQRPEQEVEEIIDDLLRLCAEQQDILSRLIPLLPKPMVMEENR